MLLERFRSAPTTAATADAADLGHWRSRLLDVLLRVALLAGVPPTLFALPYAVSRGERGHALFALLALSLVALLMVGRRLPYVWRVAAKLLLLYGVGVWLLLWVGIVAQVYLLACPVLAALLLSRRAALGMLALCTVSVMVTGYIADPASPAPAFDGQHWLAWLNIGVNFAFVGSLLTLSCTFLLQRLQQSMRLQRLAADSLRSSQESLSQIAAQVPGMVFRLRLLPDGGSQYLYVSPGVRTLFGLEPEALLADGMLLRSLWHPDDRARVNAELREAQRTGLPLSHEFRVLLADGRVRWLHATSTVVGDDPLGSSRNGIMVDISDRKTAEAQVWQQANFDALTGLPNRRLQRERLEQLLESGRQSQQPLSLMLVDLDHFKEVNDTLGHDRGDQLLVEAARRIRGCVRESDVVARMGGDEFTVILPGLGQPQRVELIAQQVLAQLAEPFVLGGERVYVSASIGITRHPDDAHSIEDLLKAADQALYVAKGAGRNRFSYFTPELQAQAQQRVRLAGDLRLALDRGQLELHYQPIVDLADGRVRKAEALLRWRHPERGWIPPDQFIPIAESTGLITEIGDWVFSTASLQAQRWRASLDGDFQISVNRSPVQFRSVSKSGLDWVRTLETMGLPGGALAVEITEGLLLDASAEVAQQLLAFRDAGIAVSLDDFGTGYSSLSYLQQMDIDILKIDRRFVAALSDGDSGGPLCKAMIVMAHQLGLKVVAEGVETSAQHDWLRAAGCDHAQGFHYARALPPEAFEAALARVAELAA